MAQAYRYPLTRVCLRGGTMTLPLAMLELFPGSGPIVAVDEETGKEYPLELVSRRQLAGLGPLYREHGLDVNDELHVTPVGEGRFSFEAVNRTRRAAQDATTALTAVLDEVAEAGVAATEAELHALYPSLPEGFDLTPYLAADPRFELRNGRWQSATVELAEEEQQPDPAEAPLQEVPRMGAAVSEDVAELVEAAPSAPLAHATGAGHQQPTPRFAEAPAGFVPEAADAAQPGLWGGDARAAAGVPPQARPDTRVRHVHERRVPEGPAEPVGPREVDDTDLTALDLSRRLRGVLEPLGFKLTPLGGGQLTIATDMGRRNYQVHAMLLPDGERLDWAALLSRRRSLGARYLAVIGDHRDLVRLTSPAELARATLWSWAALERLRVLHGTVPLTPIDLESHFERDGLFESGLQRFERGVTERVAERGATSQVLTRLAQLKAPSVFLLEELATDVGIGREAVLRILERLSEAPFQLVARVEQGEFLLRLPVGNALSSLSSYADSLRERLPVRGRERVIGLDDEDEAGVAPEADELTGADLGEGRGLQA
ncbi:MAG: hypothetical protein IT345_04520 [Trueperaceae bacterium]|nr:hypothetical protein [Trueperaceae bacterium]